MTHRLFRMDGSPIVKESLIPPSVPKVNSKNGHDHYCG